MVSEPEMQMATALVQMLRAPFDPAVYHDAYREALMAMITAKLEGGEVVVDTEQGPATQTVDLMAALKASIEATQARRTADGTSTPAEAEAPPAKAKRAAVKAPAGAGGKRGAS
ncbi:MAG: hypothetical protein EXR64_03710 [Dehalococcoidia bacterium]|nr:hypothetical protein [Dehalococcoidia bacterium]